MKLYLIFLVPLFFFLSSAGQDTPKIQSSYIDVVGDKAVKVSEKVDAKTEKVIRAFERQEEKIYKKLYRKDSNKAKAFLTESEIKYAELRGKLSNKQAKLASYEPALDTLRSSVQFLGTNKKFLANTSVIDEKLSSTLKQIDGLENSLGNAESVKQFLKERKVSVASFVEGFPFAKDLKKINKEVYYYSAQLKEYRSLLSDKKKVEKKTIELLVKSKPFKDFMRKHSQLASLFKMPDPDNPLTLESLQGLQTRAQVSEMIKDRIQSGGAGALETFRTNVEQANDQLTDVKKKLSQFDYQSGYAEMPEGFKPNSQKTKTFLNRLELGGNIQNQKARQFFPVTSDLAASVGYKLNDKSTAGIGISYKVGWGTGWDNLQISHQGVGLRSFLDYRVKGNLSITGAYEQNHRAIIKTLQQFQTKSAWQTSGLIGISKSYTINKKFKGSTQLLWDFMSYSQVPKTQPIVFRIGYKFR